MLSATRPSAPLAAFRIVLGAAAIAKTLDLVTRSGARATSDILEAVGAGEPWVWAAGAWLVAATALTAGIVARAAGIALVGLFLWFTYVDGQYSNHFYFIAVCAGLLAAADSSARWSVSAARHGVREQVTAWPVLLIQIHVSLVYLFAGLSKANANFISGSYTQQLAADSIWWPDVASGSVALWATMAVATVLWELTAPVALWIRRLQPFWFAAGAAFHAGMVVLIATSGYRTLRLTVFGCAVVGTYVLFTDWRGPAGRDELTAARSSPSEVRATATRTR